MNLGRELPDVRARLQRDPGRRRGAGLPAASEPDPRRNIDRDPRANQFRLILHTAAYWLMHAMRTALPKRSLLARAEFATLRLHLRVFLLRL